jgi:pyridoxal 5'-phosphate synthase pdxS subunit
MERLTGTFKVKSGLAEMLKGGVIMDVVNAEQAKIAEKAGAVAVMALERVPADIRAAGGVARMADPKKIKEIMDAVTIPVMAKCRIGHFVEAQILEALGVDYIDESEVLTPADPEHHIDKWQFKVPFVCGARDLPEACRRIAEGGGNDSDEGRSRHRRRHRSCPPYALDEQTDSHRAPSLRRGAGRAGQGVGAPVEVLRLIKELGRLPVVNFAAGGIATPADAALMMQLGCDGIFVGLGSSSQRILKSARGPSSSLRRTITIPKF